MQMWHRRKDGTIVEFLIRTDPPEALYWMTYKLKVSDIILVSKVAAGEKTKLRREIYDELVEKERNSHPNTVSKERKTTKRDDAKARRKQQEAG